MTNKKLIILFSLFLYSLHAFTQCTELGQNPSTAFPVCGTSTFIQNTVPICSNQNVFTPECGQNAAVNPYWYKFTCYISGTLSFLITPNNLGDDYDWQLFDITGFNPDDVFINNSLTVCANWSGTYGLTGASASGANYNQCGSFPSDLKPAFAKSPNIIAGHNYLLLISHFDNTQSGYTLSFGGGTGSITDPLSPHLLGARAICDGTQAAININKRMKCGSLSADGSEFFITPSLAKVISATGFGCNTGFDMDSLMLTLDKPLPPGNYTITIKNGSDGNTLQDNCDLLIPINESIPITVYPLLPTPMDSISKILCAPDGVQLVFRKNISCNSIAADGSDFLVTGTVPITVFGASGNCDINDLTSVINIKFSAPITTAGSFKITLRTGADGNTIIDECGKETPAGATLNFKTVDTVSNFFTHSVFEGCKIDSVNYFASSQNGINYWRWVFDNKDTVYQQNPTRYFTSATFNQTHYADLVVSNGVCSSHVYLGDSILFDNYLKAKFEATAVVCPGDLAMYKDTSVGNILQWFWIFGNGNSSALQIPPAQTYPYTNVLANVPVYLIVTNNLGCSDTALQKILVPGNCYIAVPNAFSPNGDGLNDYLYPLNAYKATNLSFSVYNRYGQLVFYTNDWTKKWDGNFKGQPQDSGTYVWILQYTNTDTGKRIEQKGTSILVR